MPTTDRTWNGTTLTDRKASRYAQLIDAGLDLLGNPNGPTVSVRAACRRSKLTERYFYESFADREALVLAVYDHVADAAQHALVDVLHNAPLAATDRAEAAVTAFVRLILDDPRKGRILLLAPMAEPALSQRGVELLPAFATLVRDELPDGSDALDRVMTAVGLVGALANLFAAYLNGSLTVPRERLIAHCVRLLTNQNATLAEYD